MVLAVCGSIFEPANPTRDLGLRQNWCLEWWETGRAFRSLTRVEASWRTFNAAEGGGCARLLGTPEGGGPAGGVPDGGGPVGVPLGGGGGRDEVSCLAPRLAGGVPDGGGPLGAAPEGGGGCQRELVDAYVENYVDSETGRESFHD